MTTRRLAIDAAVVGVLLVLTVAYDAQWQYLNLTAGNAAERAMKLGQTGQWWDANLRAWWVATGVGMAAMLSRSWRPEVALAGAVGMAVFHANLSVVPVMPVDLAAPVAGYTLASTATRRWVSYAGLVLAVVAAFTPMGLATEEREPKLPWGGGLWVPPAVMVLAWLIGDRARTRRAYAEQVAQRAKDLERERDQQAELATVAERARIARELHDAVAHGLSVIVIQAQAAAGSMDRRPATARAALASIVATGRDSLTEMRRLLGLTRPDGQELAPLPGIADLPTLVDRLRHAGLVVSLEQTGDPSGVPTGVGLTAFRIAQEALTNALKHAGGATIRLTVHYGQDAVELVVADTGPGAGGPPDERQGNGLRGMRERVAMLGGTLTVGDGPDGGFQVVAHLPLREAR